MSRGMGRIGRLIQAALAAQPDNAFTTNDLCEIAFPGVNQIEKKHTSSVLRALHGVLHVMPDRQVYRSKRRGNSIAVINASSPSSIGMAHLKNALRFGYRRNLRASRSESDLRKMLAPGGERHSWTLPGGDWWLLSEIEKAKNAEKCFELESLLKQLTHKRLAKIFDSRGAGQDRLSRQPRLL